MKRYPTLNDVFPDWSTGSGIFHYLSELSEIELPWSESGIELELDLAYHGNHSGGKIVAPLVHALIEDGELSAVNAEKIASVVASLYLTNWAKQYATLSLEYDPISNYDMTESETGSNSGSTTVTHTGTDNHSTSNPRTNTREVYAFNSTSYAPSERDSITDTGTDNRTVNLSDGGTNSGSFSRSLTRSGNIGVTTSQQMLQSERDLWKWNFFENVVFQDLDRVLTLCVY